MTRIFVSDSDFEALTSRSGFQITLWTSGRFGTERDCWRNASVDEYDKAPSDQRKRSIVLSDGKTRIDTLPDRKTRF